MRSLQFSGRNHTIRWKRRTLFNLLLVGSLYVHAGASYSQDSISSADSTPEPTGLIAIEFVTPEQDLFILGVTPGELAYIQNTETGIEYAFTAIPSPSPPSQLYGIEEQNHAVQPSSTGSFHLRFFQLITLGDNFTMKEIASVKSIRSSEDFLEPLSGLRFTVLSSLPQGSKPNRQSSSSSTRTGCCIDCGSYISCAGFVSGCSRVCMKDVPPSQLQSIATISSQLSNCSVN